MTTADSVIDLSHVEHRRPGMFHKLVRTLSRRRIFGSGLLLRAVRIPEAPVIVDIENGLQLLIDPSHQPIIDRQIYLRGTYEPATLRLMSQLLERGDGVLDIGANIGLMATHAAVCVGNEGNVIAMEPAASTFDCLLANIRLNKLTNITAIKKGAGATSDVGKLFERPNIGCGGATLLAEGGGESWESVEIVRIDDVLSEVRPPTIRLMKIDVEGYEFESLQGAEHLLSSEDSPIICMEYSVDQSNSAIASADWLVTKFGYVAFRTARSKSHYDYGGLAPICAKGDYPKHDNVYFVPEPRLGELKCKIDVRT